MTFSHSLTHGLYELKCDIPEYKNVSRLGGKEVSWGPQESYLDLINTLTLHTSVLIS